MLYQKLASVLETNRKGFLFVLYRERGGQCFSRNI